MNWQNEPVRREGAMQSNPFAGFESYTTAPVQSGLESDELAEGEGQAYGGDIDSGKTYE